MMINGMLTVKEYAEKHGKSVQAVYKQIKSKENAKALEGHIIVCKVGNKDTKLLDEVAIDVLENASKQSPQIVVQTDDKERIEELERQNEMLKAKVMELQELVIAKSDKIEQLQDILLLEQKKEAPEEVHKKSWWKFWE